MLATQAGKFHKNKEIVQGLLLGMRKDKINKEQKMKTENSFAKFKIILTLKNTFWNFRFLV